MTRALTQAVAVAEAMSVRNPMPEAQLPEVGRLRLGGPKMPNKPGTPLDFFRATAPIREDLEELARVYGDPTTIERWQSPDGPQWQTVLTQAVIHVALPPYSDTLVGPRYEVYNAGHYLTRHCDGRSCWVPNKKEQRWEPRACECDPEEPECAQVTRLKVVVLGVPAHGVWRVECHGKYAARHWPAQVRMAQDLASDGHPVPATIRIESKTGRSAVFGKSLYKVPVLRLEEAFVLGAAREGALLAAPDVASRPALSAPAEPLPPDEDVVDGALSGAAPEDAQEPPPASATSSGPAGDQPPAGTSAAPERADERAWREVNYADRQLKEHFAAYSAFQKEMGRVNGVVPKNAGELTFGAIVDLASGAV